MTPSTSIRTSRTDPPTSVRRSTSWSRRCPPDVHVDALRTAIVLAARTTFSFVTVHRDRLRVGLFLDRSIDSPRVVRVDAVSPTKIGNVIDVRTPDDVDNALRRWLLEAYESRSAS